MNLRHLLPLVSVILLGLHGAHPASAQTSLDNIEPPVSPEEEDDCEPCGCKNIGDSIHYGGSFHWKLNTGKARFLNTSSLLALSQLPSSKSTGRGNGGQPVERSVGNPLQQQVRRSYDPSGRTNVWLTIDAPDILSNPSIYTPSVLRVTGSHATVIRDEYNNQIRQILTEDGFTDVSVIDSKTFHIRIWSHDAWVPARQFTTSRYWTLPDPNLVPPTSEITFSNPDTTANGRLLVTTIKRTGSTAQTTTVRYTQTLIPNDRLVSEEFHGPTPNAASLIRRTTMDYSGREAGRPWKYSLIRTIEEAASTNGALTGTMVEVAKTQEVYDDFSVGTGGQPKAARVLSTIQGFSPSDPASQRTTTYTYYSAPTNSLLHGRLKSQVRSDHSWEFFTYAFTSTSTTITRYSSWLDLPPLTEEPVGPYAGFREVTVVTAGSTTINAFVGVAPVSRTRILQTFGASNGTVMVRRGSWDGSAWHDTISWHYPDNHGNRLLAGRLAFVQHPDGTGESWTYSINPVFGGVSTIVKRGAFTTWGVITDGTQTTMHYTRGNKAAAMIVSDLATATSTMPGVVLDEWTGTAFDSAGNPTTITYGSGETELREYACCGLSSHTSRQKIQTVYLRDPAARVWQITTTYPGSGGQVIDTIAYHGLTATTTRTSGSTTFQLSATTRHLNGELVSSTSPDANGDTTPELTTYAYDTTPTGGRRVTTTFPDSSTKITSSYRDSRTALISGDAVSDTAYAYEVSAFTFGDLVGMKTLTTRLTATGGTGEWTDRIADPLGRTSRILFPGTTATQSYAYYLPSAATSPGSRGKLLTSTDPDGVTTTYSYNTKGQATTTLVNHPGGTLTTTTVTDAVASATVKGEDLLAAYRTTTSVTASGGPPVITGVTYQTGDGLKSASVSFDRESLSVRTIADVNGSWTITTTNPDDTQSITTHQNGGLATLSSSCDTAANAITGTASVRNPFGWLLTTTDDRTGVTTYAGHTASGQARIITLPGGRVTSFILDTMGRQKTVDAPNTAQNNITQTSYYPTGQVKAQWGDQTNAAFYLYDEQNRITELRTYRNIASITEPTAANPPPANYDTTTWIYDPARGWLTGKRDATTKGANYTYTAAGRLRTRQWARGNWTRYDYAGGVQTATRYFTPTTLYATVIDPATTTGDDPFTPDITYDFDPFGRLDTAATTAGIDVLTSNKFFYNDDFTVNYEEIIVDPDGSGPLPVLTRTLDRNQDALKRSTGWDLMDGSSMDHFNAYTYSATDGRLETVNGSGSEFTYGYQPESAHLIGTVTGPPLANGVFTVTKQWLPDRDALDFKENKVGTTVISKYDYSVNGISQRDNVTTSGSAFGTATDTTGWTYNARGGVVAAANPTTAKNFGYLYDEMGNRKKSSRNTTDATGATGTDSATYHQTTTATLGGNALNQYGDLNLYGSSTIANTYDHDGNQIEGRFPNTSQTGTGPGNIRAWDGENQLISTTVDGWLTTQYTYDAFRRRVAKTNNWFGSYTDATMTLYDGWNPIAEYGAYSWESEGYGPWLNTSYSWGLDLSGSLQGAGGVGGLLAVHYPGWETFYPTYDGNGNVSEYLDQNGDAVAHYEYGPFGELIDGSSFDNVWFKHRFSTKPLDWESGYYYYGYRSYDPLSGRWLSRDPIEERGGVNLYGMCRNSAISYIDKDGRIIPLIVGAAFLIFAESTGDSSIYPDPPTPLPPTPPSPTPPAPTPPTPTPPTPTPYPPPLPTPSLPLEPNPPAPPSVPIFGCSYICRATGSRDEDGNCVYDCKLAPGNFGNCPSKPVFNGKQDFGEVIPITFEPWEQAYNPEMCNECLWQKEEYISQIYDNGNPPTLRN